MACCLLLVAFVGAACSSDAEPEIITQRLAAPDVGSDENEEATAAVEVPSTGDAADVPTTSEEPAAAPPIAVDPACAALEAAVTGPAIGEFRLASDAEFAVLVRGSFDGFDPSVPALVDTAFTAVANGDAEGVSSAMETLDQTVWDQCGFPGSAALLMTDFVPSILMCADDEIVDDGEPVEQTCPGDEVYPTELPCFGPGDATWLESLTTDAGMPWYPVSCDTGVRLAWSHRVGDWVEAA